MSFITAKINCMCRILMQWLPTLPQPALESSTGKVAQGLHLHKNSQILFRIAGRILYLNLLSNYTRITIFQVVLCMSSLFLRLTQFHPINSIIMAENLVLTSSFIYKHTLFHQLLQHLKKKNPWDSHWEDHITHINDFICYDTKKHIFLHFQKQSIILIVSLMEKGSVRINKSRGTCL